MTKKKKNKSTYISIPVTIIKKYGYEYILVEGSDRSCSNLPQPCFMGLHNMALTACRKIKNKNKK